MVQCRYREQEERSRGELRDDEDDDDEPGPAAGNPFQPISQGLAAAQVNTLHGLWFHAVI